MNFPKMFRIYLFLNLLNVAFSAQFTNYYVENLFNDVLCVSSASKLTGVFPLLSTCATRCARTFDCMSFFFNNVNQECFSVNGVLTSRDGCEAMPGTSYYLRQGMLYFYAGMAFDMLILNIPLICLLLVGDWKFFESI